MGKTKDEKDAADELEVQDTIINMDSRLKQTCGDTVAEDDDVKLCNFSANEKDLQEPMERSSSKRHRNVTNGRQQSILSVRDIRLKLKGKELLKGISFDQHNGHTLAIMGPSGAGKTVLVDMLTLEGSVGKGNLKSKDVEISRQTMARATMKRLSQLSEKPDKKKPAESGRSGLVKLNGQQMTSALFQKYCFHVPEYDRGWSHLTCRETLMYAARFGAMLPTILHEAKVDGLLELVGLEKVKDSKIGCDINKGLSVGQKRSLSLAVALLKDPKVIFLDEVTSGMDSAAAAAMMKFLGDFARSKDLIIVCTIHQPPSKVFEGFDQLLLLSRGATAYCGPASQATKYFEEELDRCIPDGMSPAEFLLDEVNCDFKDRESVQEVLDFWADNHADRYWAEHQTESEELIDTTNRPGFLGQTAVLCRRALLLAKRDPQVYRRRGALYLVSNIMLAGLYSSSRERNQETALNRAWCIIWHITVPSNLALTAVFGLNQEFKTVQNEVKGGMYGIFPYMLSQTLVQIPFMLLQALLAVSVSGYGISRWNPEYFHMMVLVVATDLMAWECIAQALCALFGNPLVGMLMFMRLWFQALFFAGIHLQEKDVPWAMRWLCHVFTLRYSINSMTYLEFHDTTFDGAVLDATAERGYRCPDDPTYRACYGYTGGQVLESFNSVFDVLQDQDNVLHNIGSVFVVSLVCKLLFAYVGYRKTRGGIAIQPTGGLVFDRTLSGSSAGSKDRGIIAMLSGSSGGSKEKTEPAKESTPTTGKFRGSEGAFYVSEDGFA